MLVCVQADEEAERELARDATRGGRSAECVEGAQKEAVAREDAHCWRRSGIGKWIRECSIFRLLVFV